MIDATAHRRRGWRPTSEQMIGILVIVVAIMSGALYVQQSHELGRTIDCQAQLNEQFRDALQARSDAARQQNATTIDHLEAERNFLVTLGQTPNQAERREVVAEFIETIERRIIAVRAVEQARTSNPLPELESCR